MNSDQTENSCPPGFVPNNGSCVCGDWPDGMIVCDEESQQASIRIGYCMTYDQDRGVTVGSCPQGYVRNKYYKFYYSLPTNVTDLNHYMCGPFNSEGLLCGKCKHHFAVPPLTYFSSFKCTNCTNSSYGWVKYLALQYLPTTILFVIIIVFGISAVVPTANALIFFGQIFDVNNLILMENVLVAQGNLTFSDQTLLKVLDTTYSLWNSNFFTKFLPDVCITESLDGLQALAMNYATAGYLLFLSIIIYICIQLHAHNFRPLVWCWRPFHKYFVYFRRAVDPRASVVDAFASFILLSYVNFLTVSGGIFRPSDLYNYRGDRMNTLVLFLDTNTEFLHAEHLPFAILAIFVLLTFVAIPLVLLLLYPTSLFQKCLTRCRMNCYALHTFADIFQGCYKNGTNGTRDFRYFAGLYFLLRIVIVLCSFAKIEIYVFGSVLTYLLMAVLFSLLRPYKRDMYNVQDTLMFIIMATIYIFILFHAISIFFTAQPSEALVILTDILIMLPLLYFIVLIAYRVLTRKGKCIQKLRCCRFQGNAPTSSRQDFTLPHRLENPAEYEVLQTDHERSPLMRDHDLPAAYMEACWNSKCAPGYSLPFVCVYTFLK